LLPVPTTISRQSGFIAVAGDISGTFKIVSLPALSVSSWHLCYNSHSVVLQVGLLDGNANNQMDSDDINIWRANFGNTAGSGWLNFLPPNATVPELASLILALLGLAAAELAFQFRHLG
jgi:hypothetical protein